MKPDAGGGPEKRRRANRRGHWAETLAVGLLRAKGYRVLARRYLAHGGEIDIVVRRGRTIAFVEVKARGRMDEAETAVTLEKRRRIARAARQWLTGRDLAGYDLRADAIYLAPWRAPRHIEAAFVLDID